MEKQITLKNQNTLGNQSKKRIVFIMIGLMLGMLLSQLDMTIVSTAMPKIISDLNGFDYYAWPMTSYMLSMTIAIPLFGKLADLYGFKLIYIIGLLIFLVGSVLSGMSNTMIALIFSRGFQGIGGGILIGTTFAIIGVLFSPKERAKYLGIVSSVGGIASIAGPTLGGYITDNATWPWIFYINIPLGIIALVFILIVLPSFRGEKNRNPVDYLGAGALIATFAPMLLAFTWAGDKYAWNSIQIISMFAFSAFMLILFVFIESRAKDPIVPLSLFKSKIFVFCSIELFFINAIMFSATIFIPLFVQGVTGTSASTSGAIITPMMMSFIVGSIISGLIVSKTSKFKLLSIIGFVVVIIGGIMLLNFNVSTTYTYIVFDMIIAGFGIGVLFPIFSTVGQSAFSKNEMGTASSGVQFFGKIGATVSSSILATILITSYSDGFKNLSTYALPSKIVSIFTNPNNLANKDILSKINASLPPQALNLLNKFEVSIRSLLNDSLHSVFFATFIIMVVAAIVALFIKEVPLNKIDD